MLEEKAWSSGGGIMRHKLWRSNGTAHEISGYRIVASQARSVPVHSAQDSYICGELVPSKIKTRYSFRLPRFVLWQRSEHYALDVSPTVASNVHSRPKFEIHRVVEDFAIYIHSSWSRQEGPRGIVVSGRCTLKCKKIS